jgi:hypothetical protein
MSLLFTFTACSKDEDSLNPKDYPNSQVYNSAKETTLIVTSAEWYLTKASNGGGDVHLKITGVTNGDRLTIENYGDGLKDDVDVELDSNKNFNKEIIISFFATSLPTGEFEKSTSIKVYRGSDVLTVDLKSGKLKF